MYRILKVSCILVFCSIVNAQALAKNFKEQPSISYISYSSEDLTAPGEQLTISGQLRIPTYITQGESYPAVVILHGSAGIDSRGKFYANALNRAGIATFEIDMWGARNLAGGENRPALPTLTLPDAYNALARLAQHPQIDANNIGVLGFSWGGVVSLLANNQSYTDQYGQGRKFVAHVANYPVCWAYNVGIPGIEFSQLTKAPVLIQIGELDDYDEGAAPCQSLIDSLDGEYQENVSLAVYKNAYHAWDRLQPAMSVNDPFSHLGQGGDVTIAPNKGKALKSRKRVVNYFKDVLLDVGG